jgi:phenylpropionate dioxygenase-like ring-hydroxylating dioxygenase large terminal subunit
MLTAERNDLITRSGPGTPLGALMRQYWQPAALSDELDSDRPVRRVRLLGEDLVLFRDPDGRLGLLHRHCAHRGADLSFGRPEDGGLRCAFHGWLFDATGACLEQPAEPVGSHFCKSIRQPAYQCREANGIIFAYMGEGEPPDLPPFDCFAAPADFTFAFKGLIECNWLQALEVGIDPAHASYLHRYFGDEDTAQSYGKQFRDATLGADMPMTRILREYGRPEIQVEPTEYGLQIAALRRLNDSEQHIRVTNMVFPHGVVIPMSQTMTITQWHVPVDDTHCYWYAIFTSFTEPVDKQRMREQRLKLYELPDYTSRINKRNDYGFDPLEQRTRTYTGMGDDINVHDQWAVESMGPIQDRTKENLGASDKAIAAYRRLLVRAIRQVQEGQPPLLTRNLAHIGGPASIDAIGPVSGWQTYWRQQDDRRRAAAPWDASLVLPADAAGG